MTRGSRVDLEQRAAALVVLGVQRGEPGLGVDAHRAELEHLELDAVAPDAALAEQHRAAVLELDRRSGDGRAAAAAARRAAGDDRDVERPLEADLQPRQRRRLDVEQRLVGDRQRLHPPEVDARQARVEVQVAIAPLLAADQHVEQRRVDVARAQHDAVDVGAGEHLARRRRSWPATGRDRPATRASASGADEPDDLRRPASGWVANSSASSIARRSVPTMITRRTEVPGLALGAEPRAVHRAPRRRARPHGDAADEDLLDVEVQLDGAVEHDRRRGPSARRHG